MLEGNATTKSGKDWLAHADLVLCCTDSQHSRVALAELAYRYLVPVLDVGVQLDGANGRVAAEVVQVTRFAPRDPCPYCLGIVDAARLSAELMTAEEKRQHQEWAAKAAARGEKPDQYWAGQPQAPTVGAVTTIAGSLLASYAIGYLSGSHSMPDPFMQIDLLGEDLGYVGMRLPSRGTCACSRRVGYADQAAEDIVFSAPSHWAPLRPA